MHRHFAYGLLIQSELELPSLPVALTDHTAADLLVEVASINGDATGTGTLVAEHSDVSGHLLVTADADGYCRLRFGEACVAVVDPGGYRVSIGVDFDPSTTPWLVAGSCLSFALALRGQLCLHSSAIAADRGAQLLIGGRGSGKSTLAALAVSAGAHLISDDVGVIRPASSGFEVMAGSLALRLRHPPKVVERLFPGREIAATSDGRTSVTFPSSPPAVRIERLLFLDLGTAGEAIEFRPIGPSMALRRCLENLRTPGLRRTELLARQFEQAADLVAAVPSFSVRTPPEVNVEEAAHLLITRASDEMMTP